MYGAGIPIPVSATETSITGPFFPGSWSPPCGIALTERTTPPFRVNLNALDRRLVIIFSNLSGSTYTSGDSSGCRKVKSIPKLCARELNEAAMGFRNWTIFVSRVLSFMLPAPSLDKSSSWLISRSSRSAFRITVWYCCLTSPLKLPVNISRMGLRIRVSGVLNSCEMFVKNVVFILSSSCIFISSRCSSFRSFFRRSRLIRFWRYHKNKKEIKIP